MNSFIFLQSGLGITSNMCRLNGLRAEHSQMLYSSISSSSEPIQIYLACADDISVTNIPVKIITIHVFIDLRGSSVWVRRGTILYLKNK